MTRYQKICSPSVIFVFALLIIPFLSFNSLHAEEISQAKPDLSAWSEFTEPLDFGPPWKLFKKEAG